MTPLHPDLKTLRIILLVLLFIIWGESASPATSHWQSVNSTLGLCIFISGYLLMILLLRVWSVRLARGSSHGDLGRAVDRFNRGIMIARCMVPGWFAFGVYVLGWKPAVDQIFAANLWSVVNSPQTLFALLPPFIAWIGLWWAHFPLERSLREFNVVNQLESDLPVFSPPTFRNFFQNKLRAELLLTTAPLLTIMLLRDLLAIVICSLSHTQLGRQNGIHFPLSDGVESLLSAIGVVLVLTFSPQLLRRVLSTHRFPDNPLRESLIAIGNASGIRCREILLWRTQNYTGNAMVMGLIPQVRYVVLSDLLLESMTDQQIQAVYAHELGHVKHRHLVWFALFFTTVSGCLIGLAGKLESQLKMSQNVLGVYQVTSVIFTAGLLWIVYGFLSRWFERQADVYAARTLDKSFTGVSGCELFASTLERVAVVNNIPINARNWTHGSILSRVKYITQFGHDPRLASRFDRASRWVFITLVVLTLLCGTLAIYFL